jgi:hypothetical protein
LPRPMSINGVVRVRPSNPKPEQHPAAATKVRQAGVAGEDMYALECTVS